MPYANVMRIIYRKVILNEADPVSRRPNFILIESMYMPGKSLVWDKTVSEISYNGNNPASLALSTFELLNVDDDFLFN